MRHAPLREPDPAGPQLVPFGPLGGGQWTGHPIGLLIVFGFVLLALVGVPESRLFFLLSLGLGAFLGSGLYLWHRRKASSEHLSRNNFCIR